MTHLSRIRADAAHVPWFLAGALLLLLTLPAAAAPAPGVEVDDRDDPAMTESAIRAFDLYLEAVDAGNLDEARMHAEAKAALVRVLDTVGNNKGNVVSLRLDYLSAAPLP